MSFQSIQFFGFNKESAAVVQGFAATGGTITDINLSGQDYRLHIFNSDGNFEVTSTGTGNEVIDVIVIGGGSSGGRAQSGVVYPGGGGAGEVIYATFSSSNFSTTTYSAVVGLGGDILNFNTPIIPGGTSSFFGLTASGGKDSGVNGKGGNSGNGLYFGGVRSTFWSGGGAGDQENGANGGTTAGSAAGGDGRDLSSIVGTGIGDNGWFAGGGGGVVQATAAADYTIVGPPGLGGGGYTVRLRSMAEGLFAVKAMQNTGSGGASYYRLEGETFNNNNALEGADGVVIIRYAI